MPIAPKKPCRQPGCPELTDKGFCQSHGGKQRLSVRTTPCGNSADRGYDARRKRFRHWSINRYPVCEASIGCNRFTQEVHHILRLQDGGERLSESNSMLGASCITRWCWRKGMMFAIYSLCFAFTSPSSARQSHIFTFLRASSISVMLSYR